MSKSNGSNYDAAREAAFEVYAMLGADAGRGAISGSELFIRVVKDASFSLINEADATEIYECFSAAAGKATQGLAKSSGIVKASNLRQGIQAGKLPVVSFVATAEAIRSSYAKASGKKPMRPLWEALVAAARLQIKQPSKRLTEASIKDCLKPFKSNIKPASKTAKVISQIEKLSDAEAAEVMRALQKRANGETAAPKTMASKLKRDETIVGSEPAALNQLLAALGVKL